MNYDLEFEFYWLSQINKKYANGEKQDTTSYPTDFKGCVGIFTYGVHMNGLVVKGKKLV